MAARIPIRIAQVAVVVVVLVAPAGVGVVLGEKKKDVSGTKHDVASAGTQACVYCHLPQDANGELLWASNPNTSGTFAGLAPLCFSCHDGTVTTVGVYAFTPETPQHPGVPGVKGQDCDRCHDPHETGYGKFIKYSGGADFCRNCHQYAGPNNHPIDVDIHVLGATPRDTSWNPDAGDLEGTRLFNVAGTAAGSEVKCLSCHSPHDGVPGTKMNTMGISGSHDQFLPLCQNCHYGRAP